MKTTINALATALALSARLVAAHAQTVDDPSSINDAHAAVVNSGLYSPSDQYSDTKGFPLPGWSQLKLPYE